MLTPQGKSFKKCDIENPTFFTTETFPEIISDLQTKNNKTYQGLWKWKGKCAIWKEILIYSVIFSVTHIPITEQHSARSIECWLHVHSVVHIGSNQGSIIHRLYMSLGFNFQAISYRFCLDKSTWLSRHWSLRFQLMNLS